ncbi:hypothetical protein AAU01_06050 [Paenarthrobacter aurescens]|uniref:Uncharacterized protein n=1 Tax=Paenarthrobacter aurescens TaxID=43663 RepID=A0A4Y3N7V3_PAEAU|nr:hypothetical protein AAU01_06050 [Paenarthrobacter aurescens]
MVIQVRGVQGQYCVIDHRRATQAPPKLRHGHRRRNSGREAKDYVVKAAGGEAFRGGNYIQSDSAAEAAMLQDRGFALEQLAVPVNPPQHQGAVQKIMKDHYGVAVGLAEPGRGCFAALAVQGTEDCEMHAVILLRSILISKSRALCTKGPAGSCVPAALDLIRPLAAPQRGTVSG